MMLLRLFMGCAAPEPEPEPLCLPDDYFCQYEEMCPPTHGSDWDLWDPESEAQAQAFVENQVCAYGTLWYSDYGANPPQDCYEVVFADPYGNLIDGMSSQVLCYDQ